MASKKSSSSLLTIVLDVSPLAWGERDLQRTAQDKQRAAAGKRSVGPAILQEVLEGIQAFCLASMSIERSCGISIFAVADNESAMVYPRKDQIDRWLGSENATIDSTNLESDVLTGVADLLQRAAIDATRNSDPVSRQAAMASAFSKALCYMNRCLVAAETGKGVAALQSAVSRPDDDDDDDDNGVVVMAAGKKKKKKVTASAWSPRILLVQASEDRSRDYNAFMNCAFCAAKQNIAVDGCFLATSSITSSPFLEQACDLTGGVFLAPSGAAQVGGALSEVLFAVFLAPLLCRPSLNLPALHKVDFRARCFETGETVDKAFVCNQCLSIFKNVPTTTNCPTCHAKIVGMRRTAN